MFLEETVYEPVCDFFPLTRSSRDFRIIEIYIKVRDQTEFILVQDSRIIWKGHRQPRHKGWFSRARWAADCYSYGRHLGRNQKSGDFGVQCQISQECYELLWGWSVTHTSIEKATIHLDRRSLKLDRVGWNWVYSPEVFLCNPQIFGAWAQLSQSLLKFYNRGRLSNSDFAFTNSSLILKSLSRLWRTP